jgi:hypothetical protein
MPIITTWECGPGPLVFSMLGELCGGAPGHPSVDPRANVPVFGTHALPNVASIGDVDICRSVRRARTEGAMSTGRAVVAPVQS